MPSDDRRSELLPGTLEMLILHTLVVGDLHGYGIARHIEQKSEGAIRVEQGSLYPALERLLDKGWAKSRWDRTPSGRRARYYTITPSGRARLDRKIDSYERIVHAIARVMRKA